MAGVTEGEAMATDLTTRFRERQRFNPWFFLAPAGLTAATTLVVASAVHVAWLALLLLPAFLAGLWAVARVDTEAGGDGVRVRLFPFRWWHIRPDEIASAEVRTYRPIREYGGWGLRYGPGGWAYNARGDRGVQLVLRDGRRVLIGSGRAEELLAAIRTHAPAA